MKFELYIRHGKGWPYKGVVEATDSVAAARYAYKQYRHHVIAVRPEDSRGKPFRYWAGDRKDGQGIEIHMLGTMMAVTQTPLWRNQVSKLQKQAERCYAELQALCGIVEGWGAEYAAHKAAEAADDWRVEILQAIEQARLRPGPWKTKENKEDP